MLLFGVKFHLYRDYIKAKEEVDDSHLLDLNASREEHVHELAVGSSSAQLLDFGKLGLN